MAHSQILVLTGGIPEQGFRRRYFADGLNQSLVSSVAQDDIEAAGKKTLNQTLLVIIECTPVTAQSKD